MKNENKQDIDTAFNEYLMLSGGIGSPRDDFEAGWLQRQNYSKQPASLPESKEVESVPISKTELLDKITQDNSGFSDFETHVYSGVNKDEIMSNVYCAMGTYALQFKQPANNEAVKKDAKYRVGRKLGQVILTVNGEAEIGRIHDKQMALRVCDFLNKDNEAATITNPIINTDLIQKALDYLHANITATVIYTDHYDYSRGVEGAEVDYFPETTIELLSEMGIQAQVTNPIEVIKKRVEELETEKLSITSFVGKINQALIINELNHILKLIQ